MRNVQIAALDQLGHLAVKECQQQGADVAAVHVSIGHDDDLVIPHLVGVEIFRADPGPKRGNQGADFSRTQHLVKTRPLDVEDFPPERQNRLVRPVARLFGRAASRVPLNDEQFRARRIFFGTVRQLARQVRDIERPLAAGQLPRLAGGLTRGGGFIGLADDLFGLSRVFLKPLLQLFAADVLDNRTHLGRDQLVLGLG